MKTKSLASKFVTAPYTLWMSIFVIVPIALVVYYAFTDTDGHFTFKNMASIVEYGSTFIISLKLNAFPSFLKAFSPRNE